eukprot:442025-Alexandrium_andersonii.AAC.1
MSSAVAGLQKQRTRPNSAPAPTAARGGPARGAAAVGPVPHLGLRPQRARSKHRTRTRQWYARCGVQAARFAPRPGAQ